MKEQRSILLSVAPKYADLIATGSKTIELRRRFPMVPKGTHVYLYSTLPVGAIVGRVRVDGIDVAAPATLWRRHGAQTGISKKDFDTYFVGRTKGCAVRVSNHEALKPSSLTQLRQDLEGFVVPQSYRYLSSADETKLLAKRR